MLNILFAVILTYIIGSFPTSFLVGKAKGVDVRTQGSGNVGATNVLRLAGKLPALTAFIVDVFKGVIAATFLAKLFYHNGNVPLELDHFKALLGLSAIAGHNWSIFLKFKGGKGVATSCGVLTVLLPKAMAIAALVWLITVLLTRYVSLGSILLALTIPIVAALTGEDIELVIFSVTICILISYRHKDNIKRLLMGIENKIARIES